MTHEGQMRRTTDGWEITGRGVSLALAVFTLVGGMVSIGTAWGASKMALAQKVDRAEFDKYTVTAGAESRRIESELIELRRLVIQGNADTRAILCYQFPNPTCSTPASARGSHP
jgi:hypothetical protein